MEVVELPIETLKEAPWNANQIDAAMLQKLPLQYPQVWLHSEPGSEAY